jgi:UDP-glucose:(heptosyl)LPS alpha-1,3-glucosyltransferase
LFVGNDFDKKGLPTLLKALVGVPPLHLAVVGQGRQLDRYRQQIDALGVTGRVHLLGSLPDVSPAYAAADCLIHPTTEDTYAMVVLEAMAHGLPVLVSSARYCGIAAELTHGVDALILDEPQDHQALGRLMTTLLENQPLRTTLSLASLQFARERSWSHAAARHESLIQRIQSQHQDG